MNENIIKGICKVLLLTLPRYKDSFSQQIIHKLLRNVIEKHPESSIRAMISLLLDVANRQKNIVTTYVLKI